MPAGAASLASPRRIVNCRTHAAPRTGATRGECVTSDTGLRIAVWIIAAIMLAGALAMAQVVAVPIAFALFTIALVWPLQCRLEQAGMPALVALLVTVALTLIVVVLLALVAGWGFGRVARWVIANAGMLQALYAQKLALLESFGIEAAGTLGELFDPRWLVRVAQSVIGQLQGVVSFIGLTLVFVILGLLEVRVAARQLERLGETRPGALALLQGCIESASKLRTYMGVRTLMSLATGVAVWAFAAAMGLDLAVEWGVIAFVLNYIPFIGPLVATLFPTVLAVLQFGTWQAAITVFAALQVIQFLGGSTIEPRLAGARLAMSPFLVLVAVFVGAFLWGIPGAFIGVPALLAALTLCKQFESARPVAALLSGTDPPERDYP
ncbi:MAG: AI-2E family transporter [Acetobacteraceae bacterium]|nr:AI-2E family transporter [Acetobacteraceae bacterium]